MGLLLLLLVYLLICINFLWTLTNNIHIHTCYDHCWYVHAPLLIMPQIFFYDFHFLASATYDCWDVNV